MTPSPQLSHECRDRLGNMIRLFCPWRPENPEFLPGLFAIVENELATVLSRQRTELLQRLQTPSNQ